MLLFFTSAVACGPIGFVGWCAGAIFAFIGWQQGKHVSGQLRHVCGGVVLPNLGVIS